MRFLSPTRYSRLNEVVGFLLLLGGLGLALSLASYSPLDPSWNTATGVVRPGNLMGRFGAYFSDLALQGLGLSAYLMPAFIWLLGWKWVRSSELRSPAIKLLGAAALWLSIASACGLLASWHPLRGGLPASGIFGMVIAGYLVSAMNRTGALIATAAGSVIALYLISTFEVAMLGRWFAGPIAWLRSLRDRLYAWSAGRREKALERAKQRAAERTALRGGKRAPKRADADGDSARPRRYSPAEALETPGGTVESALPIDADAPPFDLNPEFEPAVDGEPYEIPIRPLEDNPVIRRVPEPEREEDEEYHFAETAAPVKPLRRKRVYRMPSTELLNETPTRGGYDGQELKEVAGRIKSKLEEFNVRGSVVQINPGPVVTTFEYKPEAGVKYSRITTLTEDLCLGLQAESVLIERLPGKPTIGIEVPNTRREVISLREIVESNEFHESPSRMTIALGKDINGRIKVASLETMPHLLIAGSTGSGKSVTLNGLIMSFL